MGSDDLFAHFIERGWAEGRSYNRVLHAFIDPAFYVSRYPELEIESPEAAVRHWMYDGYYEGRVPNAASQHVLDSRIHLYQMGKVGSKAIEAAIYAAGHESLVLHFHWPSDFVATYPDCFFAYEEVMARNADKPIRVISGVRDPFERLISGFYQSPIQDPSEWSVEAATKKIRAMVLSPHRRLILDWFDHGYCRELDVYAHPFDVEAGFGVYEEHHLRLFVYRHDRLPRLVGELSRFVDLDLSLEPVNRTSDKENAESFATIMRTARFPGSVVEEVVTSRYVRHFFTGREIDAMRARWAE
ncbi:MAG: hypothetical protein KIT84_05740 [Labilithrix sp.]|nr:hypothetical protein [Labilithrix sp.]